MTNYRSNNLYPWKFLLYGMGMHVISFGAAIIGILVGRQLGGGDLIALGLAILGGIVGYYIGIIGSLLLIRRFFLPGGRAILGSLAATLWIVFGYFSGMGFAELNLNPWTVLGVFLAALPFLSLFVYSFRR